ncbi:MAG: nicotinate-nucleotide adenylyltransferase [Neisseria sp.]|nr:nicotinate-nucleotide adenylyltransferase [Neisseria sp.]
MRKIGLFGGTFDPIHRAHRRMATAFAEQIALDEVVLIPAGDPYHKTATRTPARHRLAMCVLATAEQPLFSVSDIDIMRAGATYTYDTVRMFRQTDNAAQWWWLLGSDSLRQLHTWHRYRELLRLVNFAVAWRDEDNAADLPDITRELIAAGASAAQNDAAVGQIRFLHWPPEHISSSAIRERLLRGENADGMLDEPVANYIRQHRLYRA